MTPQSSSRARAAAGRALPLAALLLTVLAACAAPAAGRPPAGPPVGFVAPSTPVAAPPRPTRSAPEPVTYPADGGNRWQVAAAEPPGSPHGTGQLLRYRVAVERDIRGLSVPGFASDITRILDGPGGWTAGGTLSLRRVGPGQSADFTIYLATPGTRDLLCQDVPDGYTSCRNGDRVVLNVARWVKGVPRYGASLATYRTYMVNHEVGHRLGHGHERCPGRGRPAPVMQQQTLGLHGCTANALPYLHGERYTGSSGAYDDPIPAREGGRAH
ncbi:DUF3152 domain-containing protein [Micromonospora sp. URMC 103]|uniref:DUF3152 domain-containing protein n=1 Tax=Micromonospora sp. URMC 103 TaxID=3423406 RepID=UPI003F1949CF